MHIDIDPGWTGAVAVLDHAGTLVALYETPTLTLSSSRGSRAAYALPGMVAWLRPYTGAGLQILIEAAQAMPVQGTHSMFQIRFGLGVWLSVLAALALPHMRAWPAIWKRALGLGKEKEQTRLRVMPLWSDPRRTQQFLSAILPLMGCMGLMGFMGVGASWPNQEPQMVRHRKHRVPRGGVAMVSRAYL